MGCLTLSILTRRLVGCGTRLSSSAGQFSAFFCKKSLVPFFRENIAFHCYCCAFFSGYDLTFRCDDNAKVKEKMIYASSKDELKKRLVGVATEVQANDKAGFDMKDVVERVSKV